MNYQAKEERYQTMEYQRCGESGLKLPAVSLGLWHNFGDTGNYANMCRMCFTAFDNGITHFDLANNYGFPDIGSAEENTGRIRSDINCSNIFLDLSPKAKETKAKRNKWGLIKLKLLHSKGRINKTK